MNGGWRSSQGTFSRWLRKPGVDFVELDGAAAREEALKGCAEDENKVDVLWSSIGSWSAEFPQFRKDGIDAVAIAQVASSNDACALIVSESVDGLAGIEGKVVTAKWSPAHWLAAQVVPRNDSINPVDSFREAKDKFVKGEASAAALCEPYLSEAQRQRYGSRILRDVSRKNISFILVARRQLIQESPEVLRDFIGNWLYGNQISKSMPDIAVQSFRNMTAGVHESVENELGNTQLSELADNEKLFTNNSGPASFDRQYEEANQIWWKSHLYTENPEKAREPGMILQRLAQTNSGGEVR